MKLFALLTATALLLASHASAQVKNVTKTISTNGLVENLVVPSGKTLTINSGGSIINNGTATGFTATAAWGSITGTLSSQTDLQTALDAKLASATAASTYQPLDSGLTALAGLADASGVLTNNGSGSLSYTATSTGGSFTSDSGKLARFGTFGELNATMVFQVYGPSGVGSYPNTSISASSLTLAQSASNFISLTAATVTGGKYIKLPAIGTEASPATLITDLDTGTVTNAMLAGSIALSKLAITGTPDGTKYLRDDGTWQTVTSGATLAGNTFTGLQQFSGTDHAGLRLNNLTTVQRDALASPAAGMVIWNSTDGRMQLHNGTSWTSGMVRLSGDTMTGVLRLPAGTVSAPAATLGDSGTGIYRSATNEFAITNNGTQRLRTTTSGVTVTGTLTVGAGNIQDLGSGQLSLGSGSHYAASGGFFATTLLRVSSSGLGGGNFTQLRVIAANTGLFENSTSPHAIYVANTYTSSTSYEAAGIRWSSNAAIFGPVKGSGGGSSRNASYHTTETGVNWSSGSGSPESVVTAPVGSLYTRTDGGASTTLYVKESGTGNTGWIAK